MRVALVAVMATLVNNTASDEQLYSLLDGPARRSALERLIDRHRHAAFSAARRILRDDAAADDVAQDAMLRAMKALSRGKRPACFATWVRVIAKRLALNAIRDARTRRAYHRELDVPLVSYVDLVGRIAAITVCDKALAELAPSDRKVLMLRYAEGLSMEELGKQLRVRGNTAKMRLHRARGRFTEVCDAGVLAA